MCTYSETLSDLDPKTNGSGTTYHLTTTQPEATQKDPQSK
jgi:hypothetical protein